MLLLVSGASAWHVGATKASRASVRMVATAPLELTKPAPVASKDWEVHKFGGASLATAELYKECSDLLVAESTRDKKSGTPTMAIVSAKGGVTDQLVAVVNAARSDIDEATELLRNVVSELVEVMRALATPAVGDAVEASLREDEEAIVTVLRSVSLTLSVDAQMMELITGYGEVWSAKTMHAYLQSEGVPTACLDARDVLVVEQTGGAGLGDKGSANVAGTDPLWDLSQQKLDEWFARPEHAALKDSDTPPVVVVTGFVASTQAGAPTTLKRSGSDYSATIFARLMGASQVTFWKNVDGVYTADPRRVPEAFPIVTCTYDEAMELAHFGAQVLHPSAMLPCIADEIPIYVRNVFNPAHPGTVIEGRSRTLSEACSAWDEECQLAAQEGRRAVSPDRREQAEGEPPIRGVTSVDNIAMLSAEDARGVPDLTSRFFSTLRKAGVSPVMVTQASSDASLCVAVEEGTAQRGLDFLEEEFSREIDRGLLGKFTVEGGHSVVAVVGEGIAFRPGSAAFFTKAMANAGVNIRAIAQGSSERQISICVDRVDCTKALRAAHASLALSNTQLSIAVVGASGQVGQAFLRQLVEAKSCDVADSERRCDVMSDLKVDFKVTALASSKAMHLSYDGIDVSAENLFDEAQAQVQPADLDALSAFLKDDYNGNRVVVDVSASQDVADRYAEWLDAGVHVVAANKRMGSGSGALYNKCKALTRAGRAQWFYEPTAPGSGLPVLTSLRDMIQSGDRVKRVSGSFSGSISYIFDALCSGVPFSEAVRDAAAKGLMEPDPRDDLAGVDVCRQLVVLARELGLQLEMGDVRCETLMPPALKEWQPDSSAGAPPLVEQLYEALKPHDGEMFRRVLKMRNDDLRPVQLAMVDVETGSASVEAFAARPENSRLARCLANEVIVEIESTRYSQHPMVLQGPGAGLQITAAGVFADLLHLSRSVVEWNIPQIARGP